MKEGVGGIDEEEEEGGIDVKTACVVSRSSIESERSRKASHEESVSSGNGRGEV